MLDGIVIEVRTEDQDRARGGAFAEVLDERDGERVDLLAGRAAHHPGANRSPRGLVPQDLRESHRLQLVEAALVPEERRDLDEEVFVQEANLSRFVRQKRQVGGHVRRLPDRHAPGKPPLERRLLVLGEVDAGVPSHERDDLGQGGVTRWRRRNRLAPCQVRVAGQPDQLRAERGQWHAEVDHACVDGALGHGTGSRGPGILREGDPAVLADRGEPPRAVGGVAGEDHADGQPSAVGGQGTEEEVDGKSGPALIPLERGQPEDALLDRHLGARRDDVDPIRLDADTVLRLRDLHGGRLGQRLAEQAGPGGLEVLDEHERQARAGRDLGEQLLKAFQAPGRRTHPHDREDRLGCRSADFHFWYRTRAHALDPLGRRLGSRGAAQVGGSSEASSYTSRHPNARAVVPERSAFDFTRSENIPSPGQGVGNRPLATSRRRARSLLLEEGAEPQRRETP